MTIKEFKIQLALGSLSYDMKRELAINPNTPKEILKILSRDKNWYIRRIVARNRNTPIETLTKLGWDEDYSVRCAVHDNSNKPMEGLPCN